VIDDALWQRIEPLLPRRVRAARHPGRRPVADRLVLTGILTVLARDIGFERLPAELGYGSGMTCWRRLRDWQRAGVWPSVVALLRDELPAARQLDFARVAGGESVSRAHTNTHTVSPVAAALGFGQLPRVRPPQRQRTQ
jgi:transposase